MVRKVRVRLASLMALVLFSAASSAVERVYVTALFDGKAMVEIDGKRRMLSLGQASPEGVILISANSTSAVLEVDGERGTYRLGSRVGGRYTAPGQSIVRILPDRGGMYRVTGSINGHPVPFLVDTGATLVAMNGGDARSLGIDYRLKGQPMVVNTASGQARAYRIKLDEVTVGNITVRNVEAAVVDGDSPDHVLLGMSFLGRLDLERSGSVMVLTQKY
jgi:aspartyl protease family protein